VIPLGRSSISVPILMYHYIRPAPSISADYIGYRLTVTPADFTSQMDWLATNGYHPVDFNDVARVLLRGHAVAGQAGRDHV